MILPKLKQLQYLVSLQDHLHFGRAAEACHVTQSTLSAGIQELEGLLAAQLVERTRRTVLFTTLGNAVAAKARMLLRETEDLVTLARAAQHPLTGIVRMGVIPTIAPFFLPQALPPLRARYPALKLHLLEATSQELCERLQNGLLDVVLYALPFRCGDLHEAILFQDAFQAAYPPGRALPPAPVTSQDLMHETLLLLEEGHCLRDHALSACNLPAGKAGRAMMATSLHTVVQMVDNGLGMTLLPQLAIDGGVLNGTAVQLAPLASDAPPRIVGLVWRKANPRAEEFALLAEELRRLRPSSDSPCETRSTPHPPAPH